MNKCKNCIHCKGQMIDKEVMYFCDYYKGLPSFKNPKKYKEISKDDDVCSKFILSLREPYISFNDIDDEFSINRNSKRRCKECEHYKSVRYGDTKYRKVWCDLKRKQGVPRFTSIQANHKACFKFKLRN